METLEKVLQYTFVLGSKSPRRQAIFSALGLRHEIRVREVDEDFPPHLKAAEIPLYLAQKKAEVQAGTLSDGEILVTADTVVWINGHALNKPENMDEARAMLREISGAVHTVFTGVCLHTPARSHAFAEATEVEFHPLTDQEIDHYLSHYRPLDKAGAYGIQEFIGYIGIKKVAGDFYNVVGFPVQRFWKELPRVMG